MAFGAPTNLPPAQLPKASWLDSSVSELADPRGFSKAFAAAGGSRRGSFDLPSEPNYFGSAESAISRISSQPTFNPPSVSMSTTSIDWGASYSGGGSGGGGAGRLLILAAVGVVAIFVVKKMRRGSSPRRFGGDGA